MLGTKRSGVGWNIFAPGYCEQFGAIIGKAKDKSCIWSFAREGRNHTTSIITHWWRLSESTVGQTKQLRWPFNQSRKIERKRAGRKRPRLIVVGTKEYDAFVLFAWSAIGWQNCWFGGRRLVCFLGRRFGTHIDGAGISVKYYAAWGWNIRSSSWRKCWTMLDWQHRVTYSFVKNKNRNRK